MASSRSLGSLTLDLIANIGGFTDGMTKAARQAQDSLDSIEESVGKFSENIGKLLEFAGVAVGLDALIEGIKETITQMDELGKSAQKVGLPVEQFSTLAAAAKLTNVATDTLVTTLTRFSATIGKATDASSQQAKIFTALGISIKDNNGNLKSSTDLMEEFADQFKELGVNTTTTAAGVALFGKNFQELIPFLQQGSEGIKDAQQEAIDLGAALSGEAAAAAAKFNDNLTSLDVAAQGFKNQLVQALLPTLNEWTEQILGLVKNHQDMENITTGLAGALRGLALVANAVAAGFAVIQAVVETLTISIANGVQHFKEYASIAAIAAASPIAAYKALQALPDNSKLSQDAKTAAGSIADSWVNAGSKIDDAFTRMSHDLSDPLTAPIKNATAGVVALSEQVNAIASKGAKGGSSGLAATTQQIAALGAAAIKSGEDVGQVQSVISAAVTKLQQTTNNAGKLGALQTALDPKSTENANKLAEAMQKLGDAVAKAQESANPTEKAYNTFADTVRQLDQLGAAALKAGAPLKQVQDLVAKGVSGAQTKLSNDLAAPQKAADAYADALNQQLDAQKAANAQTVAAVGLGDQQAQQQAQLNKVLQDGAQAVANFTKQHADAISQNDPQYTQELAALKTYWANVLTVTQAGQADVMAAQADWLNGVNKAWANFVAQQNNVSQISNQLTTDFLNQGSDAFASFISGTKSAKTALTDFINSFEQEITQAVSKQLLKSLFSIGNGSGSSGGSDSAGLFSYFSSFFNGSGGSSFFPSFATGGNIGAGTFARVNENGPELLSVGGKDYLMMGGQGGNITPNNALGGGGPSQTNNFWLAAPTSPKTQTQIANRSAYEMRRASRLN